MNPTHIAQIVESHLNDHRGLISILEEIQAKYSYLPEEALLIVAEKTGRSLVDIYGVATFYRAFSLKPRGKHLISVCLGTACHVRGGPTVANEFKRQLGIEAGDTTPDKEITLETVNCLGACALGPVVVVDGHYFPNTAPQNVKKIIHETVAGIDKVNITTDQRIFPVEVSCPRCNHSLMDTSHYIDGHPSIRVTISFENVHGWLRMSCLYGSFAVDSEYRVPMEAVVSLFCPHCHAELVSSSTCDRCSAPMVPMYVRGGGMIQICSRRGCKGHMLDLSEARFG